MGSLRFACSLTALGAFVAACGSTVVIMVSEETESGEGGAGGATTSSSSSSSSSGSSASSSSSSSSSSSGTGGSGGKEIGPVCATVSEETTLEKLKADIIFIVDNSASMNEEIAAIEQNINVNFATIMTAAQLDFQVVMLTDHGIGPYDVCVGPPLSTGNCSGAPAEVPGLFYHYDVNVQSHDSLCIALDTLLGTNGGGSTPDEHGMYPNGWAPLLREEAIKFFVEITDDGVTCSWNGHSLDDGSWTPQNPQPGQQAAVDFDKYLLQLASSQFGTNTSRRYKFYGITGVAPNNPPSLPYDSNQPIVNLDCYSAVDTGVGYQWLTIGTGGYRFPVCEHGDYGPIFSRIADDVLVTTAIPCTIELPEEPMGQTFDLEAIDVTFQPSPNAPLQSFEQVPGIADCLPGAKQFFVENGFVELCPDACATVINGVNDGEVSVDVHCVLEP